MQNSVSFSSEAKVFWLKEFIIVGQEYGVPYSNMVKNA